MERSTSVHVSPSVLAPQLDTRCSAEIQPLPNSSISGKLAACDRGLIGATDGCSAIPPTRYLLNRRRSAHREVPGLWFLATGNRRVLRLGSPDRRPLALEQLLPPDPVRIVVVSNQNDRLLRLYKLHDVGQEEIQRAAQRWARQQRSNPKAHSYGNTGFFPYLCCEEGVCLRSRRETAFPLYASSNHADACDPLNEWPRLQSSWA